MALLTPGYWQSTYWPSNFWQEDYWPEYGTFVPPVVTPPTLLGGVQRHITKLLVTADGEALLNLDGLMLGLDGQVFLNFGGVYASLDGHILLNLNMNKPIYMIIN